MCAFPEELDECTEEASGGFQCRCGSLGQIDDLNH